MNVAAGFLFCRIKIVSISGWLATFCGYFEHAYLVLMCSVRAAERRGPHGARGAVAAKSHLIDDLTGIQPG